MIIGIASKTIDRTSAAGVAIAVKRVITNMAIRHDLMMLWADSSPAKLNKTRKTGITNATPTTMTSFNTKSKYVLAERIVASSLGAKLVMSATICG